MVLTSANVDEYHKLNSLVDAMRQIVLVVKTIGRHKGFEPVI